MMGVKEKVIMRKREGGRGDKEGKEEIESKPPTLPKPKLMRRMR